MLMLALRLIVKVKGGKQHCLPFVGSNLEVEIFLKKRDRKGCVKTGDWDTSAYFLLGLQKSSMQNLSAFNCLLVIKGVLKALFTFIFWLLSFSDLPS